VKIRFVLCDFLRVCCISCSAAQQAPPSAGMLFRFCGDRVGWSLSACHCSLVLSEIGFVIVFVLRVSLSVSLSYFAIRIRGSVCAVFLSLFL
jgi:hypothetical protein